jgi:threonine/homoserine/homoserine lactone efflux protein
MALPNLPLSEFIAAWAFLALNVLTPGPNVLNTIALAIGSGRRAALGAAVGTGVGISMWCLAMVLGVAAMLAALPWTRVALTLVAIGLLIWFALRYLRQSGQGFAARRRREPPAPMGKAGLGLRAGFWRSLSILIANPKALTTWLTLTAIFPVAQAGGADVALLCAGAALIALGIHSGYAIAFSSPAAARGYLRAAPVINLLVGLFFTAFAGRLAVGLF